MATGVNREMGAEQKLLNQLNQQKQQLAQAEAAAKAALEANIQSMSQQMPAALDINAQVQGWASEMQAQSSAHNNSLSALNASISSMVGGGAPSPMGGFSFGSQTNSSLPMNGNFGAPSFGLPALAPMNANFGFPAFGQSQTFMPMNANFGSPNAPWTQPWSLFYQPSFGGPQFSAPAFQHGFSGGGYPQAHNSKYAGPPPSLYQMFAQPQAAPAPMFDGYIC